jgi:hypothetical protein
LVAQVLLACLELLVSQGLLALVEKLAELVDLVQLELASQLS